MSNNSSSSESEDEEEIRKELPTRSTRGVRMEALVGEAADADADFWNQDAWKEISEDEDIGSDEYSSDEQKDIEDEDFDDVDEDAEHRERIKAAEQEEELAVKKNRAEAIKRKKGIYADPALKKAPTKRVKTDNQAQKSKNLIVPASSRVVRASTSTKTFEVAENVQRQLSLAQQVPKKPKPLEYQFTQQQLLEEAAKTEIENKRSLALMLMLREEDRRESHAAQKQAEKRIIYFSSSRRSSRNAATASRASSTGVNKVVTTMSFTHVNEVPAVINCTGTKPPEVPMCSVTGLPAKYRDPKTGIPFLTIEAFKVHRGIKTDSRSTLCS